MKAKEAPLWKWLVVILIIISMPLFFSFVRSIQIKQALNNSSQPPEQQPSPKNS